MTDVFDETTPFILIARIRVKPQHVDEYIQLARTTDQKVMETEPGMLHHTFDQDPDDKCCFTWSEVYKNDSAFSAHLSNPVVGTYLEKHAELGESFSVEVYGTVGPDCLELMPRFIPLKVYNSVLGYSRVNNHFWCF